MAGLHIAIPSTSTDEESEPNLYCWGRSQDGQAGQAASEVDHVLVVQRPTPILSLKGVRVVQVSCGSRHTLALDDKGNAFSWGWGLCGQLGHGDYPVALQTPRVIASLAPSSPGGDEEAFPGIKGISAGGIHSAAIDLNGRVFTWGESSYGQLGTGPTSGKSSRATPEQVFIGRSRGGEELKAVQISCGGMHTAAVTPEGVLYCWGRADNGQLGIGRAWLEASDPASNGVVTPAMVSPDCFDSSVKQVSCGAFHTAVVTVKGTVFTWGREEHGMLGHDVPADNFYDALDRPKVVDNMATIKSARMVACGGWHTTVVTDDGRLFSCGRGEYGRLGFGQQSSVLTLTEVKGLEGEQVVQSSCGGTHTLALTASGKVFAFGRGDYGRLGNESSDHLFVPQEVASVAPQGYRVVHVCAGGAHSAAVVVPEDGDGGKKEGGDSSAGAGRGATTTTTN